MHYSDLLQLYFERCNALQWYWTLYVVIIGGLLAFSSIRTKKDWITGVLVTVLFCCFAYKNLGAIEDVVIQRAAIYQAIQYFPTSNLDPAGTETSRTLIQPTLITTTVDDVRYFHIGTDVLTIAAIWAMELRRIKNARNETSGYKA